MSHTHKRLQYATAPGILCAGVERYIPATGVHEPFDATGWTLYFRMWRNGSATLIVDDEAATQPEVGQLLYSPVAGNVATSGDYRGVFWAVRTSDGAKDVWPVQTITIAPVDGGALVAP